MRVARIRDAGAADVYNMEVDGTHDFAVQGGIIAHNCYDETRYLFMENPISPRQNVIDVPPKADPLNQFRKNALRSV